MKTNVRKKVAPVFTAEGAVASKIGPELQLRRSVLSCMLFEDSFYEDGESIANRIQHLVSKVKPEKVAQIAIEARTKQKLRHVPLLLVREMARLDSHKELVSETLQNVIQRADELSEFVSIYWKDKKQPLSNQVKKGLARAFVKFDEFSLGRYQNTGAVSLRDVLFLTHAKPQDKAQGKLWKKLVNKELSCPEDTWEVAISATKGEGKKEAWTKLLKDGSLKALALLRNLRNLQEAGVEDKLIRAALQDCNPERVLPFRFIAAARYAPKFEPELEELMFKCLDKSMKLSGSTALLVDISGSMDTKVSGKSELRRVDAACALAMLLREVCKNVDVYTFSDNTVLVPARRGFALRDAIVGSQSHGGTNLGLAVNVLNGKNYDRSIVITDEQSHDRVNNPSNLGYLINVASEKNGVGYGKWTHIDGWSESIVNYMIELENSE
jgi:TROVE domain-containing protein